MSAGKRPGGLTALAVINFILGALGMLGIIGLVMMLNNEAFYDTMRKSTENEAQLEQFDEQQKQLQFELEQIGGPTGATIRIGFELVAGILLVFSGVGLLKQKRFLGRGLANAYAVLGIVVSIGFAVFATMRFNMLMDIFYPLLMLFLVNFTFKDDLVR